MSRSIPPKIEGILEPHFETGTEGIVWSVYADRRLVTSYEQWSYDKLYSLHDGDRLIVYAPDNKTVVFDDFIDLDWNAGIVHDPGPGGQEALGFWVHGIQRGFEPDDWARFFFPFEWSDAPSLEVRPLWATLYKAPKPKRAPWRDP